MSFGESKNKIKKWKLNGAVKPIFILLKLVCRHGVLTSSGKSCIIIATGVVRMQATPAERAKNSTFFKAVKERKLGQLANEPLEKIRFGAR